MGLAEEWGDIDPSRDEDVSLRVMDLVARRRGRGPVRVVARPERGPDDGRPRVELVVGDARTLIAIEHTRTESYPNQTTDSRRISDWGEKVHAGVDGRLPEGRFELVFDPHAVDGVRPTPDRVAEVVSWVLRVAPTLTEGRGGHPGHIARAEAPDVPVPVSLARWKRSPSSPIVPFQICRWAPDEAEREAMRLERLRTALSAKCPKLDAARPPNGETMLILETDDIALSSIDLVEAALRDIDCSEDVAWPTWIVLLETDQLTDVTVLREDDRWTSDGEDRGPWSVDLDEGWPPAPSPNERSRS